MPADDRREQQKRLEQRREQRRQVLLQVVRVPDAARQRVKVDRPRVRAEGAHARGDPADVVAHNYHRDVQEQQPAGPDDDHRREA